MSDHLKAVPLTRQQADEYVAQFHRHHDPVGRDKFRLGAEYNGKLVGIVQVGNPVARGLCDGRSLEVVRLCTDGTKNACSFLYNRAARIAFDLGFDRIYTYILESESGTSLEAAGWKYEGIYGGGSWNHPSRPRKTTAPTCKKKRYVKERTK